MITEKLVAGLNDYLESKQYDFRFTFHPWGGIQPDGAMEICLASSRGCRCPYIYMDDDVRAEVESWLHNKGIAEVLYNNTQMALYSVNTDYYGGA